MQTLLNKERLIAFAGAFALLVAGAEAKPGHGGGHGGKGHEKAEGHGQGKKNYDKPGKWEKGDKGFDKKEKDFDKKEWNDEKRKAARFRDDDRTIIHRYFEGYRGEPHGLPPGLAKNLQRGKPLPPGWQKKLNQGQIVDRDLWDDFRPVEPAWFPGVPIIPGTGLYWYGDRIVRVHQPTREILDVIPVPSITPNW